MTDTTTPTNEERTMAALSHASIIMFGMGAIAAIVIWATQKDKSRYVAYQALQAIVYQIATFLVFMIGMCCWLGLYFLSMIPLMTATGQGSEEVPAVFIISMLLMFVPFALMGLATIGGLWGAVRAMQGREFRYLIVGDQLERWLAQ